MVRAATAASVPAWSRILLKGQSTDAQLKKLKELHRLLSRADSKELGSDAVRASLAAQLIDEQLLLHKAKEIRSATACCLAAFLRACAPDAPYEDDDQIAKVFTFFLSVLAPTNGGGIGKPSGALFHEATSILNDVNASESIQLLFDTPSKSALTSDYFSRFFSIVKPELPKEVELGMAELLRLLLQGEESVPNKVVEILTGFFHPTVKKTNHAAWHLATLVCSQPSSELQLAIGKHYAEALSKAMAKEDTPEFEPAMEKIHSLLVHINKAAPKALYMVITQLEDGLKAQNDTVREVCVKTVGQMFAAKASLEGGGGDMAQLFVPTWKAWLGRSMDKNASVRMLWTEAMRDLLVSHPELQADLEGCIVEKLQDPDEKVRVSMLKTFGSLDFETLLRQVPTRLIEIACERVIDAKESVRLEALDVAGRMYALAYPHLEKGDKVVQDKFLWIPDLVLSMTSVNDMQYTCVPLQHILAKYILPLPTNGHDEAAGWTKRFLFVLKSLRAEATFLRFLKLCNLLDRRDYFDKFVVACKTNNGGIIDGGQQTVSTIKQSLQRSLELVASRFPDPAQAEKDLSDFAKQNDDRAYKLLSILMDCRSDLKTYLGAYATFNKKMQLTSGRTNSTMVSVALMASFPFVGSSSIPEIVSRFEEPESKADEGARVFNERLFKLMREMSCLEPAMFARHVPLLVETMAKGGRAAAPCLLALAKLQRLQGGKAGLPLDKANIRMLRKFAETGSHREAKYAAKLLALLAKTEEAQMSGLSRQSIEELCEIMAHDLASFSEAKLAASMAALKQFAKHAADVMMHLDDSLVKTVVQCVLTKPWSRANTREADVDAEKGDWEEDGDIDDDLQSRMSAIEFITQRCLSHAENSEAVHMMIKPVLKMLFACLEHGQPLPTMEGKGGARARIRSTASTALLKLARNKTCESNIGRDQFELFAATVQDETSDVRTQFLRKLLAYCCKRTANLPPRYYCLPFMAVLDPDEDNRAMVLSACLRLHGHMTEELRLRYFDVGLARLMHLLCHYPDFDNGQLGDLEGLLSVAEYINFYLDCCATKSNMACLYYIANRCKGHQDIAGGKEANVNLYRLADLTMLLIKKRADLIGCHVGNWMGKANLPGDLYAPMPSRTEQNEVYKQVYLTDEEIEELDKHPFKKVATSVPKRKLAYREEGSKKKARVAVRKSAAPRDATSKRSRKRRAQDDDDDGGSEMSDDAIEDNETITSRASSTINEDDEKEISEDEEVEASADEGAEGRGARVREKQRREKVARNEDRMRRRQAAKVS